MELDEGSQSNPTEGRVGDVNKLALEGANTMDQEKVPGRQSNNDTKKDTGTVEKDVTFPQTVGEQTRAQPMEEDGKESDAVDTKADATQQNGKVEDDDDDSESSSSSSSDEEEITTDHPRPNVGGKQPAGVGGKQPASLKSNAPTRSMGGKQPRGTGDKQPSNSSSSMVDKEPPKSLSDSRKKELPGSLSDSRNEELPRSSSDSSNKELSKSLSESSATAANATADSSDEKRATTGGKTPASSEGTQLQQRETPTVGGKQPRQSGEKHPRSTEQPQEGERALNGQQQQQQQEQQAHSSSSAQRDMKVEDDDKNQLPALETEEGVTVSRRPNTEEKEEEEEEEEEMPMLEKGDDDDDNEETKKTAAAAAMATTASAVAANPPTSTSTTDEKESKTSSPSASSGVGATASNPLTTAAAATATTTTSSDINNTVVTPPAAATATTTTTSSSSSTTTTATTTTNTTVVGQKPAEVADAGTANKTTTSSSSSAAVCVWGVVARFANGKQMHGVLEKEGKTLKWKGKGIAYKWERKTASAASGLLGEWFDAGGSKVEVGHATIKGPTYGLEPWYPAEVLQLTGARVTRISARFADGKKMVGTLDVFGTGLLWTPGGERWRRKTPLDDDDSVASPFGVWSDENGKEIQLSDSKDILGEGSQYPGLVLGVRHSDPLNPKPPSSSKKNKGGKRGGGGGAFGGKKKKKKKGAQGALLPGVDIVAVFANKVRLEGSVVDEGHQILWKGGYKWHRTIETGGLILCQGTSSSATWGEDIKGQWYDAVKVPVTIGQREIKGPLNGWYPAKVIAMRKEWGGADIPVPQQSPPKPKPKPKIPKMIRNISSPAAFTTPRPTAAQRQKSSALAKKHRYHPDITVTFANGIVLKGYMDASGQTLLFKPGNYQWTRLDTTPGGTAAGGGGGGGVYGLWRDAGLAQVRIVGNQILGPQNGWYPAKLVVESTFDEDDSDNTDDGDDAAISRSLAYSSSKKKKNKQKKPPSYKKRKDVSVAVGSEDVDLITPAMVPADIKMLSIAETRAEIERVQGEIQGLEHQLKSVRSSSSSKKVKSLK